MAVLDDLALIPTDDALTFSKEYVMLIKASIKCSVVTNLTVHALGKCNRWVVLLGQGVG